MIFGNTNDVLMSEANSKNKTVSKSSDGYVTVQQSDGGNASQYVSNQAENVTSNGRESVASDAGYISSCSCDRPRILSIEEDPNATEYNAVISPCNATICDVLNDTFIASNRSSPEISDNESAFEKATDTSPSQSDETKKKLEDSLCERAKSIPPHGLPPQDLSNLSTTAQTESYYDQKIDFDMLFDGMLETAYSDLTSNQSISSIFSNSNTPSIGFSSDGSPTCTEEFQLSAEDFSLDEEISFNLHGTCQTLPSLMEFSRNEASLQPRLCNNNTNFVTYQEEELLRRNRLVDTQVFTRSSSGKHGAVSSSNAGESKAVPTSAEEEAWRSYLENPLTAATTAMMSIHGDEDSAAALGMLYDYYKVPKEKRLLSYPATITELKNRSSVAQKTLPSIPVEIASNTQKGELISTVLPPISSAKPTIHTDTLQPRGVAEERIKRFESISDVTKQQRTTIAHEMKVKRELSQIDCETQKTYVTKPSVTYSSTANSTYLSTATIDFAALSTQNASSYTFEKERIGSSTEPLEYVMEAPKSLKQKEDDPTMSYINKGQFYAITLRSTDIRKLNSSRIKSVIHIVFGDQKPEEEQQRHWKYWHARQHTIKQRIIDIADYKESNMIYDVEEIAHNAIGFSWNANETAKIFISCNCLSTDFSAQKGIKGLPLLLQIDSYVDGQDAVFHRGQCQIKIFCDKGAERKIRDEERKATRRRQKNSKPSKSSSSNTLVPISELKPAPPSGNTPQGGPQPLKRLDFVMFKAITDIETRPVLFIPGYAGHSSVSHAVVTSSISPITTTTTTPLSPKVTVAVTEPEQPFVVLPEPTERTAVKRQITYDEDNATPAKIPRENGSDVVKERILLYVRRASDEVYDGLMLQTPDLAGLKLSIQDKFGYASEHIKNIFKKSKKGILVRMDDNIIRHYSNEDTFIIDIRNDVCGNVTKHTITLTEV